MNKENLTMSMEAFLRKISKSIKDYNSTEECLKDFIEFLILNKEEK